MKKYIKILGIILVIIVVLGLIFCFIDNARIRNGKVPIFCYNDSGGSVILYYGLGYTICGAYDDIPGGLKYCKIYTWIGWIKEIFKEEVIENKKEIIENKEEVQENVNSKVIVKEHILQIMQKQIFL